ncbi:hypothetical protein [Streptomyces sp. NPDC089919]|uniref:hypothetical protein n=1 Tax=Streptomyces sp. NPDC089919 TaxID=3155188 RepID=UPI003430161B
MRIRTVLTAGALAAGILFAGATTALADDGGLIQATRSAGGARSAGASAAAVVDGIGPVYANNNQSENEWDRGTLQAFSF